jgi:TRAP-type C4-dicarboxylate transport system permease small subunit
MIRSHKIFILAIESLRATNSLIHSVGGICLLILTALTDVNVLYRYFGKPIEWCLEVSLILFLMSIFLCWGFTTRSEAHVQAIFILRRLPIRIQAILKNIYTVLSLCIFLLMIVGGVIFTLRSIQWHEVTDILSIPLFPFKMLISIGAFFVVFELFIKLFKKEA